MYTNCITIVRKSVSFGSKTISNYKIWGNAKLFPWVLYLNVYVITALVLDTCVEKI